MSLLEEVSATLEAAGVRHALIGAGALAVYGVSRSTADLDLLVADQACLSVDLWSGLQSRSIEVEIRKGDWTDPLAGVVRLRTAGELPLDVVVGKYAWQARLLERSEVKGCQAAVVRASDLVLLKLYAGGLQDSWDVLQLLARPFRDDLVREVESRLADLPLSCSDLWRKLLKDVIP